MRGPERSGMTTAGYSDPCDLWIVTAYASSSSSSSLYEYSTIRPSSKFTVMVSAKSSMAGFANTTSACFVELDEGTPPSIHPAIHILPPIFSIVTKTREVLRKGFDNSFYSGV